MHDGDEHRVLRDRIANGLRIDQAVALGAKPGDADAALALQGLQRIEHGLVLGGDRDDVASLGSVETDDGSIASTTRRSTGVVAW